MPEYSGSKHYKGMIFPLITGNLFTKYGIYSLGPDGLRVTFLKTKLFSTSAGISYGGGRRSTSFLAFKDNYNPPTLQGTPRLITIVGYFAHIKFTLPKGRLIFTTKYLPLKERYDEPDRINHDYNAFLISLTWVNRWMISQKLFLMYKAGLTLMDDNYASAYYGIHYSTAHHKKYRARAGLKDVSANAFLTYMHTRHIGFNLLSGISYLSPEAKDSPIVETYFQFMGGFGGFYNF